MSIRLIHGDCLEVMPTLDTAQIDGVLCDPPYGCNVNTDYTRFSGGTERSQSFRIKRIAHKPIVNDNVSFDPTPWLDFPAVILWGSNHFAQRLSVGTMLIWQKKRDKELGTFLSDAEVAWQKGGKGVYLFAHRWNGFLRDSECGKTLHPTQKPVALMRWCLERMKLPKGATVLDPYMGSGPVGIACIEMGYNYIGIEIERDYYEIAQRRIESAQEQIALPLKTA